MKTSYKQMLSVVGAIALSLLIVPSASAGCGQLNLPTSQHVNWHPLVGQPHLVRAALTSGGLTEDESAPPPSIVGFWHVHFISEGSKGIPDGAEIDAGYSQWHSDGTEIMNSGGRAPDTGAFCLGVWAKVGASSYQLNHFAAAWDPTKNELLGPANIKEMVTLGPNGEHFTGTFSIDQYDESGNQLAHVIGKITGDRIGVNTPPTSIF